VVVRTLDALDMAYPKPDPARRRELLALRGQLARAAKEASA
jgi:hypothetical protein